MGMRKNEVRVAAFVLYLTFVVRGVSGLRNRIETRIIKCKVEQIGFVQNSHDCS